MGTCMEACMQARTSLAICAAGWAPVWEGECEAPHQGAAAGCCCPAGKRLAELPEDLRAKCEQTCAFTDRSA